MSSRQRTEMRPLMFAAPASAAQRGRGGKMVVYHIAEAAGSGGTDITRPDPNHELKSLSEFVRSADFVLRKSST